MRTEFVKHEDHIEKTVSSMKNHIKVMATIKEDETTDASRLHTEVGRTQLHGSRQINVAGSNVTKLHSQTSRPRFETVGAHISRIHGLVELEIESSRDGQVSLWSAENRRTRAGLLGGGKTQIDWRGLTPPQKHGPVLLHGQLRNVNLEIQLGNIIEFIHSLAKLECALIELGDNTITHSKNTGMIGSLGESSAAEKCELRYDRPGFSSSTLAGDQSGLHLPCSNGAYLPQRRNACNENDIGSMLSESSANSESLPCSNEDYLPHRRNGNKEDDICGIFSESSADLEPHSCSNGDYYPPRKNVNKEDDISSILSESSADSEPLENQRRLDCLHLSVKKKALIRWILRKMCIAGRSGHS